MPDIPAISTLPVAPARTDEPADFVTKADNFVGALPQFATQINASISQANTNLADTNTAATVAIAASLEAVSSANFKGEWSGLSGAKNVPLSCSHNDVIYILKVNVLNIAAIEPGVTNNWASIFLTGDAPLVTDSTPQLGGPLDPNGHYIGRAATANVASAATIIIPETGDYTKITGVLDISTMQVAKGREFTLEFRGIMVMRHEITRLMLPTTANITTAVGDVGQFYSLAANSVICTSYLKKNGEALVGGGVSLGADVTAIAATDQMIIKSGSDYHAIAKNAFEAGIDPIHLTELTLTGYTYANLNSGNIAKGRVSVVDSTRFIAFRALDADAIDLNASLQKGFLFRIEKTSDSTVYVEGVLSTDASDALTPALFVTMSSDSYESAGAFAVGDSLTVITKSRHPNWNDIQQTVRDSRNHIPSGKAVTAAIAAIPTNQITVNEVNVVQSSQDGYNDTTNVGTSWSPVKDSATTNMETPATKIRDVSKEIWFAKMSGVCFCGDDAAAAIGLELKMQYCYSSTEGGIYSSWVDVDVDTVDSENNLIFRSKLFSGEATASGDTKYKDYMPPMEIGLKVSAAMPNALNGKWIKFRLLFRKPAAAFPTIEARYGWTLDIEAIQPQAVGGPGADGADGEDGTDGVDGSQGIQGVQGIQGNAGNDGTNGTNGTNGADASLANSTTSDLAEGTNLYYTNTRADTRANAAIAGYAKSIPSNHNHNSYLQRAATIVIPANEDIVFVNGAGTISAMTVVDNRRFTLIFLAAVTLTHGASLNLPTGASTTLEAGDVAVFQSLDANSVICLNIFKESGQPLKPFTSAYTQEGLLTLDKPVKEKVVSLGNRTGDLSAVIDVNNGVIFDLTATGNITINSIANMVAGQNILIRVSNAGGSGEFSLTSSMLFLGGNKSFETVTIGAKTIYSIIKIGTVYYCSRTVGYI